MLKKAASDVLTSLRGSTYRSVRLAPSLAAALLDNHFEHSDVMSTFITARTISGILLPSIDFF
jgi:hypothetical protein